jgi:hypothetical protein
MMRGRFGVDGSWLVGVSFTRFEVATMYRSHPGAAQAGEGAAQLCPTGQLPHHQD